MFLLIGPHLIPVETIESIWLGEESRPPGDSNRPYVRCIQANGGSGHEIHKFSYEDAAALRGFIAKQASGRAGLVDFKALLGTR